MTMTLNAMQQASKYQDSPLQTCSLNPDHLVDLLCCKLCPPNTILKSPTTLSCGHTVCATHLGLGGGGACPIENCIPTDLSTKYSSVRFAITVPAPGSMTPIGSDVRLVQIISLALEYRQSTAAAANSNIQGLEHRVQSDDKKDGQDGDSGFTKDLVHLLTCEICLNLLEEPTTTPCQHTFCLTCIQRSLDHTPNCPLCRHHFPNISIFELFKPHVILSSILLSISPTDQDVVTPTQDSEDAFDTPIFVCALVFPDMPTILHIFEPRYRMMLRRALKSENGQFGMIMSHEDLVISYGTMLRIQSIRIFDDGRSAIQTWGTHRFRILNRGERDGYMVGKVERIDDLPEAMERELERNATMYIPPRTPPVQPFLGPVLGHSPMATATHQETAPVAEASSPPMVAAISQPPAARRRSHSPSPSLTSLNSISTLSSTHSVPPSSAASTAASQSPGRRSTRSYGFRRFRARGSASSQTNLSSGSTGTIDQTHAIVSTNGRATGGGQPAYDYPSEMSTDELVATCLAFVQRLRRASSQVIIQRLNIVGPVPEDKAVLSFWIAQLLPIDNPEKSKLLPIRSPRLRLRLVVHWIDQLNAAWWFRDSGCVIA